MSTCPNCQNELDEDFGVTTCSQCGTSLMIDMDGVATAKADSTGVIPDVPQHLLEGPQQEFEEPPPTDNLEFAEPLEEEYVEVAQAVEQEPAQEENFESSEEFFEEPVQEEVAEAFVSTEPQTAQEAFAEVAEFANPTEAIATGRFAYKVKISGIDSPELSQRVREVIEDPKMRLSADELMSSVSDGTLVIDNMNPVKAHKVIQGLFSDQLKFEWEQYEIHSS